MIDVSSKFNTLRYARAEGKLHCQPETLERVRSLDVPKGNVLEVARAAGIAAAKRTSEWMIFCHPIPLDWVEVTISVNDGFLQVTGEVRAIWRTGVEMEALTAVSAALLNIYDMLKPLDDRLRIGEVELVEKKGGKSNYVEMMDEPLATAVVVISTSTHAGDRQDRSGKAIQEFLQNQPVEIVSYEVVPDERDQIENKLIELADTRDVKLILTTGGTGLGPSDLTPEATHAVIEHEVPGITEAIRKFGQDRTPFAMLSRGISGVRGNSLIINLPGSTRGAIESLQALFPGLLHAFPMMGGGGHDHGK